MRKLEEFVNERLKVTKNSGSGNGVIVTTLRKFLAWFTGEPDYTINKFDIRDREFISSDKKMSKEDKTDFLYKCLDAAIYVTEEEKSTYDVSGLNGEVKVKLYDYSFEIGNITFSIDARIYNENELLSKNAEYFYKIVEKLKVSKDKPDTKFETTLNLFIREYFYIPDGTALYSNDVLYAIKDGVDLNDESDLFAMTIKKYFDSDFNKFQNWIYKLNKSKIQVFETVLEYGKGIYPIKTKYEFDLDDKHLEFLAYFSDEDELISNVLSENITEKLKVSKKNANILQVELRNFISWYLYDDPDWDEDELKFVEFARNTTDKYFDSSYKKLYEFITKHETDVIYVSEEYKKAGIYMYSFEVDGIPFEVQASVDKESELLSNQYRILIEKLKVTKDSITGNIKSTMKGFFFWYWGYNTINDDFWDSMEAVEFVNDVIEQNFNNMNEFLDWFSKNMDDIVYFEEVKDGKDNYRYTFSCDGMEFVIDAWISPENGIYLFSKSQYIIRRLHEKLRVTKEHDRFLKKNKLKDVIFNTFNIRRWEYKRFQSIFEDARKEYFDNDAYEMFKFLLHNENREVEYSIDVVEWLDDTTKMVELYFVIDGKEFKEQFIEED